VQTLLEVQRIGAADFTDQMALLAVTSSDWPGHITTDFVGRIAGGGATMLTV